MKGDTQSLSTSMRSDPGSGVWGRAKARNKEPAQGERRKGGELSRPEEVERPGQDASPGRATCACTTGDCLGARPHRLCT